MRPTSLGDATILRTTDKAMLVELEDIGGELWVPLSVVHDDSECYVDRVGEHDGELVVADWWAEKEGLP